MSNKLEYEIDRCLSVVYKRKELYQLTEDVAVKFSQWVENDSWQPQYLEQQTFTSKELFNYFINNVYKPYADHVDKLIETFEQFKAEQKPSAVSDEEIEKMAEKEYPYEVKKFEDFEVSNKSIQHFINTVKEVSRKAFIKGFKSALQTNVGFGDYKQQKQIK
jgi:hypothetical protein